MRCKALYIHKETVYILICAFLILGPMHESMLEIFSFSDDDIMIM
jgi:hypothetical protein